jgi:hypothetical protein
MNFFPTGFSRYSITRIGLLFSLDQMQEYRPRGRKEGT